MRRLAEVRRQIRDHHFIWNAAAGGYRSCPMTVGIIYISSMVIRIFVYALERFKRRRAELVTIKPRDDTANEILISVDLAQHFEMVDDVEAAHAQVH